MKKIAAIVVLGVGLSGCSHWYGAAPHDPVIHGALVGAGVGGVAGGVATGTLGGAAVGAGIGAVVGALLGTTHTKPLY
jgi:hypothetical protein